MVVVDLWWLPHWRQSQTLDPKLSIPRILYFFYVKFSMAFVGVRFVRLFCISLIWG